MKFKPISSSKLKTYSLKNRKSKVSVNDFAKPFHKGKTFEDFLNSLPNILAAENLKEIASSIVTAHKKNKTVAVGIGGHVIKVGLSPVVIDLMEQGIINAVAMNGACIVHDFEIAYAGKTSEDVDAEIDKGEFGMAEETGRLLNNAIKSGVKKGWGIGKSVGEMINNSKYLYRDLSILAAGARLGVPVTVHVAIGTDIIHIHPQMGGRATGEGSLRDFKLFAGVAANLEGGVYLNIGSAVLLPEVFLKALTLVRNLGYKVKNFTTVNMDFIQHYRPLTNVVRRPTKEGGRGYTLTGHHEIMVPLLAGMIKERLG
ncbi:MAG: deoxyhypusine synthase family protein [Deltaproteobacteria bacterium]|nr:deoxyhypusine synthase family protein [Deltaproteobacteria bacterium]